MTAPGRVAPGKSGQNRVPTDRQPEVTQKAQGQCSSSPQSGRPKGQFSRTNRKQASVARKQGHTARVPIPARRPHLCASVSLPVQVGGVSTSGTGLVRPWRSPAGPQQPAAALENPDRSFRAPAPGGRGKTWGIPSQAPLLEQGHACPAARRPWGPPEGLLRASRSGLSLGLELSILLCNQLRKRLCEPPSLSQGQF